jgi:hypothetical protein
MAKVEVKRTPDGRIFARRTDLQPLTPADREEARILAQLEERKIRAWIVEEVRAEDGNLSAALIICSAALEDHLWLVIDRGFEPKDELAIYYPEELAYLKTKTPEQLQQVHKAKLAFPGSRVIQEGPDEVKSWAC